MLAESPLSSAPVASPPSSAAVLLTNSLVNATPGVYNYSVAIPAQAMTGYRVKLTRSTWPVGPCATIVATMTAPSLSFSRTVTVEGGDALDRQGVIATTSAFSQEWPGYMNGQGNGRSKYKPITLDLAVTLEQTLTTTITIESL